MNNGIQIISSGSDGLLKIWLIKSGECLATLDHHAARVWAIASKYFLVNISDLESLARVSNFSFDSFPVNKDESKIVTGGADSRVVIWQDKTEESRLDSLKTNQERIEQEQHLANLVRANELLPALQLAIKLDRPMQAFKILESKIILHYC